jgi:hypothetical protein
MNVINKEFLEQAPGQISPVGKELPENLLVELFVFQRFPVIHAGLGDKKLDDLAPVIDHYMQFEAEEPVGCRFPLRGDTLESLVGSLALDVTNP